MYETKSINEKVGKSTKNPVQQKSNSSAHSHQDNRLRAAAENKFKELANNDSTNNKALQLKKNNENSFQSSTVQLQPVALSDGKDDEFASAAAMGAITPASVNRITRGEEYLYVFDYTERYDCQIHIHETIGEGTITAAHIKSHGTRITPAGDKELRHSMDLFLARRMLDSIPGPQPTGNA